MVVQFTHLHSSSRFDRPLGVFEAAVNHYHSVADLVTYTEMTAHSRDSVLGGPGWDFYHASGERGDDDCVIEWKTSMFTLVSSDAVKITNRTWRRSAEYGGNIAAPTHVVRVTLSPVADPEEKIAVFASHMPLSNTALRASIWIDCCAGWVDYVQNIRTNNPGIRTLLAADWNKHFNVPAEHALMQTHIAGPLNLRQVWDGHHPIVGGTHGTQRGHSLIDGDMTDMVIKNAWLIRDDASSDHRPFAAKYQIGQGSPVPNWEEQAQIQVNKFLNALLHPQSEEDLMKILTFNVRRDHGATEVVEDIAKSIVRCDASIVGLQEAWQYTDEIDEEFSEDWYVIHPDGSNPPETERISAVTVLMRRDRFYVESTRAWKGCSAAGDMPSRYVIEVLAEHIASRQRIKYINTHMNTGVQPHGSDTSDPATAAYRDHINTILGAIEDTPDEMPLFLSADWNVSWSNPRKVDFWPMKAFGRNGLVANWSYDRDNNPPTTFKGGGSLFDQIYHRKTGAVRFKSDNLIKNDHSDHFGVSAAYGLVERDLSGSGAV